MNVPKILHFLNFLWASAWSVFLLVMLSPPEEPDFLLSPVFAVIWMGCAVALLLFDFGWAWYGSFVCSLVWLFLIFYLLWMQFAGMQDDLQEEGSRMYWKYATFPIFTMLAIAAVSASVTAILLHTRHRILKDRFNEWSVQFVHPNKRLLWGIVAVIFLFVLMIACVVWHYDL
jgi:hypothetical protein